MEGVSIFLTIIGVVLYFVGVWLTTDIIVNKPKEKVAKMAIFWPAYLIVYVSIEIIRFIFKITIGYLNLLSLACFNYDLKDKVGKLKIIIDKGE